MYWLYVLTVIKFDEQLPKIAHVVSMGVYQGTDLGKRATQSDDLLLKVNIFKMCDCSSNFINTISTYSWYL